MRRAPLTGESDQLDTPGMFPGNEPDVGKPIDDPSTGVPSDPSRRDPLVPEVDGPAEPGREPQEWPDPMPPTDPVPPRVPGTTLTRR